MKPPAYSIERRNGGPVKLFVSSPNSPRLLATFAKDVTPDQAAEVRAALSSHMGLVGALSDLVNTCGVPTGPETDREGFNRAYDTAVKLLAGQPAAPSTPDYTGLIAALATKLDVRADNEFNLRDHAFNYPSRREACERAGNAYADAAREARALLA